MRLTLFGKKFFAMIITIVLWYTLGYISSIPASTTTEVFIVCYGLCTIAIAMLDVVFDFGVVENTNSLLAIVMFYQITVAIIIVVVVVHFIEEAFE